LAGKVVVDASTVLAFLNRERGGMDALRVLPQGVICAVNIAEVVEVRRRTGHDSKADLELLELAGLAVIDADREIARLAGELAEKTRSYDISLADRFCLALAITQKLPVLTADRIWGELGTGLEIRQLR